MNSINNVEFTFYFHDTIVSYVYSIHVPPGTEEWLFFSFSVVKQNDTIIMDVIVGTGGDI